MALIDWTQEQWIDFFEKLGPFMSIYWLLYDNVIVMEGSEVWATERVTSTGRNWQLRGVKLGENTDENGRIYLSVAATYGGYTISLYSNPARTYTYLIAQGTHVGAFPGDLSLSEMNSSGVTGDVRFVDNTSVSTGYLDIVQGLLAQIGNMSEDDSFDAQVKALMTTLAPGITANYIDAINVLRDGVLAVLRNYFPDKLSTAERSTLMYVETQSEDGTVNVEFTGIGEYILNAMNDQTSPAGAQTVAQTQNVLAAVTTDPNNVGTGQLLPILYDHARIGIITIECVIGGVIGTEEFEVSLKSENGTRIVAPFRLKIDGLFESIDLGIERITPYRYTTEVSDPENRFSNYETHFVTANNSNGGNLYYTYNKVTDVLYVYSDSARTALVGKATGVAGGGGPVVASFTEENDSGLSGQVVFNGTDPSTDEYDFQAIASTFEENDRFYMNILRFDPFSRGKIATFFGRLFGLVLPSDLSNTIPDAIADRGFGRINEKIYYP